MVLLEGEVADLPKSVAKVRAAAKYWSQKIFRSYYSQYIEDVEQAAWLKILQCQGEVASITEAVRCAAVDLFRKMQTYLKLKDSVKRERCRESTVDSLPLEDQDDECLDFLLNYGRRRAVIEFGRQRVDALIERVKHALQ